MSVKAEAARAERITSLAYDYGSQPKCTVERCNLCASTSFVGLTHRDRYGFPVQAHACPRCGLPLRDPLADELLSTLRHADELVVRLRARAAAP